MLLGDDLDNFHNFFHQLLELWIIHVVLSLMSRLVHTHLLVDNVVIRFDIQLDSFRVSTNSAIAIRMLPVFRFSYSSSTLAHHRLQHCASSVKHIHHCLLLHYAVSSFRQPIHRFVPNFPNLQSTNHRLAHRFYQLILKLIRLVFQVRSSRESR